MVGVMTQRRISVFDNFRDVAPRIIRHHLCIAVIIRGIEQYDICHMGNLFFHHICSVLASRQPVTCSPQFQIFILCDLGGVVRSIWYISGVKHTWNTSWVIFSCFSLSLFSICISNQLNAFPDYVSHVLKVL